MDEEKTESATEPTYTREALAASKKYRDKCDLLMIALEPEKEYTIDEVDNQIEAFLKKPLEEEINGKKKEKEA